jgi:penicillin-binding protein 2
MFTPLQMANYIAAVANGGTLYKPHLIRTVEVDDGIRTIVPEIVSQTDIEYKNYQAVIAGMSEASEAGTAASVFANYKVKVASKTGTASVATGAANAIFVAFAPLENPEIAIAVVVEHGGHGSYAAPIAKDVFDEYFNDEEDLADLITIANDLIR